MAERAFITHYAQPQDENFKFGAVKEPFHVQHRDHPSILSISWSVLRQNPLKMGSKLSHDPVFQKLPTTDASGFFIEDLDRYRIEKPYLFTGLLPSSQEHLRTNIITQKHDGILIHDLKHTITSIDRHGFQITRHESQFANSLDRPESLTSYLHETTELLKLVLSAELALCYNFKACSTCILILLKYQSNQSE